MSRRTLYNQTLPILVLLNALVARADYSNTVMSLNAVAYWPLNEGSRGDVALNQSTNNRDLEVHYSGSVTSGVTGAIVADTNAAVALDGSTAYLFVPFHPALSQAGAFSIEGWFKPRAASPACILSCGAFGSRRSGWVVYFHPPHGWNFRMFNRNSPAPSLSIEGGDTSVEVWHHIVAVHNGTHGCLYVDGSLAAGPTAANDYTPNQEDAFSIGSRSDNVFPFNGSVDEVALYTNALTASLIQGHFQNGTNHFPSDAYPSLVRAQHPLFYCRLDETIFPSTATMSSTTPPVDSEAITISSQIRKSRIALNYGSLGAAANGAYLAGTRPCAGPPFRGFGMASYACEIHGGYVGCTSNPGLDITGPMTAIAWIKAAPGVNRFQTFLGRSDASWRASVDISGRMRWADGTLNSDAAGVTQVNDGAWHFFAGVYDGRRNYVYVDGKLEGMNGATSQISGSAGMTLIGSVTDYSDRQFQGSVAQIAIYTNALSAADILRAYQSAELAPATEK